MTTSIEYALMASSAYAVKDTVTHENNTIPIPNGWVDMEIDRTNDDSGFTARAYRNIATGEIVIAYTGTTFEGNVADKAKDWVLANIPAGSGAFLAPQVTDAAKFYLDVLNANPGAQISFTGHSLGGGLSSLMAVFFDRPATVFDEAPFEKSADSLEIVDALKGELTAYCQTKGYALPAAFSGYKAHDILNGAFIASPTREARDDKVTHYYVRDEILSLLQTFGAQAALLGIGLIDAGKLLTLALNVDTIVGKQYYLEGNTTSGNGWGWPGFDGNPVDMHAVQLLDAFLMSPAFLKASQTTPELLQALFTSEFNYAQQSADNNLLSLLVRRQVAGEKPLEALAADIGRVRNELADVGIGFTLTDLALRMYYAQGFRRETGAEGGAFQQIFTPLSGGIQITRNPVDEVWTATGFADLETWLRGKYDLAAFSLAGIERYSLSDSSGGLLASAPNDARRDLMLGGAGADALLGGGGDDLLFGETGNDWLEGGAGNDTLSGGWGMDIYKWRTGDGNDKLIDPDGGWLFINDGLHDLNAAGVFIQQKDAQGNAQNVWKRTLPGGSVLTLTHNSPWTLMLEDGSSIQLGENQDDFENGDFGIHLVDQAPAVAPALTLQGDLAPIDQDAGAPGIQLGYDALDNVLIGATPEPGRADVLYDSAGDDLIQGLGGNDILYAWRGGADRLEGGDGDDILDAGPGADLATGNAGQDLVWGLAGADVLYGGDEQALDAALLAGETQVGNGQKGDLLGGGGDNDSLIGDAGNDALAGGAGGDLLIGGGGDDNLMGDEDLTNANLGWSLTRNVISDANGNTQYQRLYNNVDAAEAANGGADILYGGAGNDWLLGQMGDDILDGGSGDDVLFGGAGGDVMLGQAGDDLLIGDDASAPADQQGDGYLDGGAGDDTLKGGIGADQLIGDTGDDTLFAFDGDDHLDGGAGQDWLIGDDLSVAGAQHGADTLDGGDDDDYLFGQGGGDRMQGGQGNDYLQGDDGALAGEYHGNDSLDGGAGSDTLLGDGGHDTLDGGDGDDSLFGDNHPSQPLAEEFQGNDTLNGGAGLDYLEGGAGDDVYRFTAGDSPLIGGSAESINDSAGHDRIEFGAGVGAGNIHLYQYGQDMALQYGGNDWLWIYGGFKGAVESFGFDNGVKMSWMQLIGMAYGSVVNSSTGSANATLSGGNQNDSLTATGGGSSFSGGKGDDTLAGAGGGNTYLYNLGDGSDTIQDSGGQTDAQGNSAPNVLSFGEGITADDISLGLGSLLIRVGSDPNDTIRIANFNPNDVLGQRAIDRFVFADGTVLSYEDLLARGFDLAGTAGNDTITGTNIQDRISGGAGNDILSGGAGDDRLAGGSGNDVLSGGAGSDTYEFNLGDGGDTLDEAAASVGTDVLVFGSGINPSDISAVRNGDDLEFRHANGGDKVVVANWFSGSTGFYQLDRVEFADGTQWLATNISQMLANSPPTGNVTLGGTAAQGQALTAGNTLADADGLGTIGYQWQTSADGTTWGNLAGATGASFTLSEAQVGQQLRVVASYTDGQGKVEAVASAASAAVANVNDAPTAATPLANQAATQGQDFSFTLPVHAFIDPDQVHGDALSHAATQADGSALPAWLSFNSATKTFSGTPANGDVGELSLKVTATDLGGLAAAQTFGLAVANINDAPSLSAPLADQLAHAGSAFTFQLPANTFADIDMGDVLAYHATRADGTALPAWLTFDPTTRTFKGTPGASDVGQFDARVVATDAGGLTAFDVFALAIDQDAMTGTPDDDNLVGAAGDDTLSGGAGNDVLDGGAGADLLLAGAGDDGFLMSALDGTWAKGYGVLNDGSPGHAGSGQVIAIAGRKANHDVMDGGDGWDTLTGTGFDDVIVLDDRFSPTALSGPRFMNIEQFAGGGGNDIIDLTSQIYVYGDVILDGGEGKDVLWAGSGNDRLIGGAGNDLLDGGYGADTMIGGSGNDTYTVDNPGDVVTENAGQGTDTVKSSVSHTLGDNVEKLVLTGGTAINGTGNPLNNTLTGNGGANTLDGGAGNDILQGGKGNDTYLFNRGGGVDTWIENDAAVGNVDVGRFGLDILHDQIWFLHKGNNLEMSAIGTSDKAVLKDWYLGGARHLERFEAGDGRVLLDGQVDALVQAMAAFTPPAAGQTSLPANYHDALAPVLAANWQ